MSWGFHSSGLFRIILLLDQESVVLQIRAPFGPLSAAPTTERGHLTEELEKEDVAVHGRLANFSHGLCRATNLRL